MRLNNKGFAITAVLYGLLILFVVLVSSYLLVLSAKKDRVDTLINEIENNYMTESIFPQNLSEYIISLYTNEVKRVVTNNSIKYNYAESVNLMNDRLGGTTSDYDAGNIRYYGAAPNNYIDIGDRDSNGNVILYRIIGLFKDMELSNGTKEDLIKVIRDKSIGTYAWDNKTNGIGSSVSDYGSNDWSDARLMMLLNPGFDSYSEDNPLLDDSGNIIYGYEGSLWWNSKSGTCYAGTSSATKSCNFTSTGLSTEAQDKIETVIWNLGGWSTSSGYSNEMYGYERGTTVYTERPTEWTGKVALMYLSDYGYATDFNSCSKNLYGYDSSTNTYEGYATSGCYNNDWLFNNAYQWQLTPFSAGSYYARFVYSSGFIYNGSVNVAYGVRPAFYLKADLNIVAGDGTKSNPYRI